MSSKRSDIIEQLSEGGDAPTDAVCLHEGDDSNTGVRRKSTRPKVMTEKGLLYMLETKEKRLMRTFADLEKMCAQINELMSTCSDSSRVQRVFTHWLTMYETFVDIFNDCVCLMSDEKLEWIQSWYSSRSSYLLDFRRKVDEWFLAPAIKPDEYIVPSDSVSLASKGSKSSISSSIASAKLREKQKSVELELKAAGLQRKREMEKAKLRLQEQQLQIQLDEEQIQIEEEIAISRAKAKVIESFEIEQIRAADNQHLPAAAPTYTKPKLLQPQHLTLDPMISEFIPQDTRRLPSRKHHDDGCCDSPTVLAPDVMMSFMHHLRKPTSEIKKFGGSPLEYRKFMRQFRSKVVINSEDDEERMNFLEQFTVGEPNKIVAGFGYLDAEQGYKAALVELEERYGDPEVIVSAFIKRALDWPVIKVSNPKALDEFSIFLSECQNAVNSIEAVKVLEFSENFRRLVGKLPYHLHDRWRSLVFQIKERGETVRFSHLVEFVRRESKKANDPTFGRDVMISDQKESDKKSHKFVNQRSRGSFAINTTETSETKYVPRTIYSESRWHTCRPNDVPTGITAKSTQHSHGKTMSTEAPFNKPCIYCDDKRHSLDRCDRLSSLLYSERIDVLKYMGLCFACLKPGHLSKLCRYRATCRICNRRHLTVLHNEQPGQTETVKYPASTVKKDVDVRHIDSKLVESHIGIGTGESTFAIIPVNIRVKNSVHYISTYAFLDNGSNVSFCSENLMCRLGAHGTKKQIKVDTMGEPQVMTTYAVKGLEVCDLHNENVINLGTVYTKQRIPATKMHIPTDEDIAHWPHLGEIHLPQIDAKVELLIGSNVPDAYTPMEIRTGPRGSPHASRTLLGWVIWNLVRDIDVTEISANRAEVFAIQSREEDSRLEQLVQKYFNIDFPEKTIDDKREHSINDHMFLDIVQKSIKKTDGHYEMSLPFANEKIKLPNNEKQAQQRLTSLKKKFEKNPEFQSDYTEFMESIIRKGYAEQVPGQELTRDDGRVWYIPHHGVYHPHKPGKIRVVFDCAASYLGVSLNSLLSARPRFDK